MVSLRRAIALFVLVAPLTVYGAEAGDVTVPLLFGTTVWTYRFAQNGQPAKSVTISDQFVLLEGTGVEYFITDRFRVGLLLQFNEAITNPPPASSFTLFALLPEVSYNFWGPLTVSVLPSFILRFAGTSQFGFALQPALSAGVPLGGGFSFVGGIAVPFVLTPATSVGLIPFVGVSFRFPRSKE